MRPELLVAEDPAGPALELVLDAAPGVLALAGGSTPKRLYERLAEEPLRWSEMDLFLTDERCVPATHPDSNLRVVEETLLSKLDRRPRVHPFPGQSCDADTADRAIRGALGGRSLDVAVLGLGADGHTASLFPGDPALAARDRTVVRVEGPDHPRLTLTAPVLSSARLAVFLVVGEEKREAVGQLLRGADVPAARVAAGRVVVAADPAAGAGLT